MSKRKKLVFLLQTPPPIGGVTVKGGKILGGLDWNAHFEVKHVETGPRGYPGSGRYRYRISRAIRAFRESKGADIVFVGLNWEEFWLLYPIVLLRKLLSGRMRVVVHKFASGFHHLLPRWWPLASIVKRLVNSADVFTVETLACRDALQASGYEISHMTIPNFSDTPPTPEASFDGHVLFLGQVRLEKGIDLFLQTSRAFPSQAFKIVGPLFDDSEALLRDLPRNVEYHGDVRPEDVSTILARSKVLIMPSRGQHEGHPGVIVEAMAHGVPVVAANTGEIRELLAGAALEQLMMEVDSLTDLVDSLSRILTMSYPEWKELSSEVHCHARRYATSTVLKGLLEILISLEVANEGS